MGKKKPKNEPEVRFISETAVKLRNSELWAIDCLIALCIQVNTRPDTFNSETFIHHIEAAGLGDLLEYAKNLIEVESSSEQAADVERSKLGPNSITGERANDEEIE